MLHVLLTIGSIFLGIETALIFLFCPETTYTRSAYYNIDLGTVNYFHQTGFPDERTDEQQKLESVVDSSQLEQQPTYQNGSNEQAWTFWQQIRPFRGIESEHNVFKVILRPFLLLLFPQILYVCITAGLSSAWLSMFVGVSALIYGGPPYNFSASEIGLLVIGILVASLLGFMAGPINDSLCKYMARNNNGIYEPEVISHYNLLTSVPSCNEHCGPPVRIYRPLRFRALVALSTSLGVASLF